MIYGEINQRQFYGKKIGENSHLKFRMQGRRKKTLSSYLCKTVMGDYLIIQL